MGVSPLGPRPSSLGPFLLQLLFAGAAVGLVFNYGGQWAMHRVAPPHNVSAAVHQRVSAMGLDNVVVGMPTSGDRAPFDARAGMVFMNAPLSANRVIYVRRIEQWADKARQTFPDRQLYELIADKEAENGFVIRKVGKE